jgi:hypothetical protein
MSPERAFGGRRNKKLRYAVLAAAALHGGTDPDLLDEVAWWQTDDFWQYALFATVASIAPPPAGRACRYARHARTWPSAPAIRRHNDQFGTPCQRSSNGGAGDHNGGYRMRSRGLSPASTVQEVTPAPLADGSKRQRGDS